MGSCQVVAEVILLLPLLPSYVAATKPDLLLPDGPAAALGDRMILRTKEKMGDEGPADPIVPGSWCLWQGATPHLADVSHVVRMVHVKPRERIPALGAGYAAQIDLELPWAWGPVNPAFTCQERHGWCECTEEVLLVLHLRVSNERSPVRLTEPLSHSCVVADPRLCLGE